jgi:C1A family cysteine protease
MPIRMVPDDNDGQSRQPRTPRNSSNRRGGGGAGGMLAFLPMILGFLMKRPKFLLILLVIAGIWYFGRGCFGDMLGGDTTQTEESNLGRGADLDPKEYDKAEVFEPLAETSKNTLPERVSLRQYCPTPRNQGHQGSCVGWSSSYAARTILEARASGNNPNSVAFSPSSLYNQISLPNCQGAYINKAMDVMHQRGVLPWKDFPYDVNSCDAKPSRAGFERMASYRTRGYNRLTPSGAPQGIDMLAMKQHLAQGAPVVIGMMVGGSFMQGMQGRETWIPNRGDYSMRGFGGHAMCVIGYDDYKDGGSFEIMNSWGRDWGKDGFCWVRYSDVEFFTKEAYGLYPMGNSKKQSPTQFEMAFGLVDNASKRYIPIQQVSDNYFETTDAIAKGTKFKLEVGNTIECYTYIFGMETDGSSYVLFPYTAKHSPFCGITGTRIFPKDHSLMADNIGTKDYFAMVVTKQPIQYEKINQAINQASGNSYLQRVNSALRGVLKQKVRFIGDGKSIGFSTDTDGNQAVAMVIGVNKR